MIVKTNEKMLCHFISFQALQEIKPTSLRKTSKFAKQNTGTTFLNATRNESLHK